MAKRKTQTTKEPAATESCELQKKQIRDAAAVVAQILTHFGAGYAAGGTGPKDKQIFAQPGDIATFHALLLDSTIRNWKKILWKDDVFRNFVCSTSFKHGKLARELAEADGLEFLEFDVILETLRVVQKKYCGSGPGGGPPCEF